MDLPVIVSVSPGGEANTKGLLDRLSAAVDAVALRPIPVEKIAANLKQFCSAMNAVLLDVKSVGGFRLSEITLQVEITAEGGIALVGTGKAGASGAITLTFTE
jgi:hypothetical protein